MAVLDGRAKELKGLVRTFAQAVAGVLDALKGLKELKVAAKTHPWIFTVDEIVATLQNM